MERRGCCPVEGDDVHGFLRDAWAKTPWPCAHFPYCVCVTNDRASQRNEVIRQDIHACWNLHHPPARHRRPIPQHWSVATMLSSIFAHSRSFRSILRPVNTVVTFAPHTSLSLACSHAQYSSGLPNTLTPQKAARIRKVKALVESKRMNPSPLRIVRGVIFGASVSEGYVHVQLMWPGQRYRAVRTAPRHTSYVQTWMAR